MKPTTTKFTHLAFAALALVCFAALSTAQAVTPAPDGGYPHQNTAEGTNALFKLTSGDNNTAIGFDALYSDTIGRGNTATGLHALHSNTTGSYNTANGDGALYSNTIGSFNTGVGQNALNSSRGNYNTAIGFDALDFNTTGNYNTATGSYALYENAGDQNTAIGYSALVQNTGNNNIAVGWNAGSNITSGNNNIDIGAFGYAGDSNVIRIGMRGLQYKAYIQGISGNMVPSGVTVFVDANGRLGTSTSSARFKDEIKPMDKASEIILALKPVTFRYKKELDPERIPQFGLVAEDVAKVNPDLVICDPEGKPYTVRYEAVNAMLLNEFLKAHNKVEQQGQKIQEQDATIAQLKSGMQALTATVKEQESQIQKVSAQLKLSKLAPQTVRNNQ
jgi:Chaperone of endosialidase